jgi:hypothetical protein
MKMKLYYFSAKYSKPPRTCGGEGQQADNLGLQLIDSTRYLSVSVTGLLPNV